MLAGTISAFALSSVAQGVPTITAIVNTTDPFLVANGLQSAVIQMTGFQPGETYQGYAGTTGNPWTVSTHTTATPDFNGSGFFNIATIEDPLNPGTFLFEDGFYASPTNNADLNALTGGAAPFDSGLLGSNNLQPNGALLGNPVDGVDTDDIGGFGLYSDGSNDWHIVPAAWITLNPLGIDPPGTTITTLRITWSANEYATVSFSLFMNTPPATVFTGITLPPVPAPGVLALLGLASLVTGRRRNC